MMLTAVLTCQSATETAKRNYETWKKHCDNIVFVTTVDSHCWVPDGVEQWKIGRDMYNDRDNPHDELPRRTVDVLQRFMRSANTEICIIEYDVLLFGKPVLKNDWSGTIFPDFIHPPWVFTRQAAHKFTHTGEALLRRGCISGGWPDRHLKLISELVEGLVCDPSINYSRNTLDKWEYRMEAREAVRNGAWSIHGCKTNDQFEHLMAPFDDPNFPIRAI